jgi:DNA-binding transcriptional regulator WhiA
MSFSTEVKEELSKLNNLANKEEVKYEFLGYLASDNITEENNYIKYSTENDYNIDRFAKIIRNIGIEDFNINVNGKIFFIEIDKEDLQEKMRNLAEMRMFLKVGMGLF